MHPVRATALPRQAGSRGGHQGGPIMRTSSRMPWLLVVLASLALLADCSSSASTARGQGTTPTATSAHATPPSAPPHALAWTQFDGSGTPQIWASINSDAPAQITHVAPA